MRNKIVLVLLLILALLSPAQTPTTFAQYRGAEITNIYCEAYSDLIRYTFDFEVWGMRNEDVFIGIWPVYTGSDYLVEFDGTAKESNTYSDVDGNVVTASIVTPPYRSSIWEGFVLEIPLGVLPPGDYEFYPYFQVQAMNGDLIRWQAHPMCSLTRPAGRSSAEIEGRSTGPMETQPFGFQMPRQFNFLWNQPVAPPPDQQ